jgi:hypothetical protein
MAIQTGMPLGCVTTGVSGVTTVTSLGPAISSTGLGAMVATSYVVSPAVEVKTQPWQMPAVFAVESAHRATAVRAEEALPPQSTYALSGRKGHSPGAKDEGPPEGKEVRAPQANAPTRSAEPAVSGAMPKNLEDLLKRGWSAETVIAIIGEIASFAGEDRLPQMTIDFLIDVGFLPKMEPEQARPIIVQHLGASLAEAICAMAGAGWREDLQEAIVVESLRPARLAGVNRPLDFEEVDVNLRSIASLANQFQQMGIHPKVQQYFMAVLAEDYLDADEPPPYSAFAEILEDMRSNGWRAARVMKVMLLLRKMVGPELSSDAYEPVYDILKRFITCNGVFDFAGCLVDRAKHEEDPEGCLEQLADRLKQVSEEINLGRVLSFLKERRLLSRPAMKLLEEALENERLRSKFQS